MATTGDLALLLAKGALLGLSVAAPVGPMALLCFRATLGHGLGAGIAAGLGVAAGDGVYAAVAAFGLAAASGLLDGRQPWLGLLGGGYLIWFGVRAMLRPPAVAAVAARRGEGLRAFATTFLLTLANPPTVMIFAAMFAGLGLAEAGRGGSAAAGTVVAGVLLGSAGWWLLFALAVSRLRERVRGRPFAWINRISGAALAAFGLWALTRAVLDLSAGP